MMSFKLKLLKKISQDKDIITNSPPEFIASSLYNIDLGFGTNNALIINHLCNLINSSLFYISNGKYSLLWMKNQNFNFGTSDIHLPELKYLMNFSKTLFYYILNNGKPFDQKLSPQAIEWRKASVAKSADLNNLPTNLFSKKVQEKIGGSLKTQINNYLTQIK